MLSGVDLRTVSSLTHTVVGHALARVLCCDVGSAMGSGGIFRVRSSTLTEGFGGSKEPLSPSERVLKARSCLAPSLYVADDRSSCFPWHG